MGFGPQTDEHLPQSPFTEFLDDDICIAFYESYLSTYGKDDRQQKKRN